MSSSESTVPDSIDPAFADELVAFVSEEVSEEPIAPDSDLLLTGLVDSLGVVMIVEWIERRLDIAIDPGDVVLENFRTVDAMLGYLRRRPGGTSLAR